MIYFVYEHSDKKVLQHVVVEGDEEMELPAGHSTYRKLAVKFGHDRVESENCRHHNWERVVYLAQAATSIYAMRGKQDVFLPVDHGTNSSSRFSVCVAPKIGSPVSRGYNGDYTPEGEITKISKSYRRVETSTGCVFYRKHKTATWKASGTWSMVGGHHNDRNPSF